MTRREPDALDAPEELLARARAVELLILDVDGVLTDGRIYYGAGDVELKAFHTRDGAAMKELMAAGVGIAIISGRRSAAVRRRARELDVPHLFEGASDKARALDALARRTGIAPARMAHVGDDRADLPLFEAVGLAFAVPDAHPLVRARADYVTHAAGGFGAVREVCDLIAAARQAAPGGG